jgi:16S rRNA (adenine1518-N6/adenine1519-N6)-dimethyltransferase
MGARLGQHFLVDDAAAETIVAAALPFGKALEIGPGRGVLTEKLLRAGAELTVVELDERLAAKLSAGGAPGLRVVTGDFLRFDLAELGAGPFTVVANLPYAVGTPILQKLLLWDGWDRAVLMFQKEVADRVVSEAGLLRLSVWLRAEAERILDVPRTSFRPSPKVDSAVVRLARLPAPKLDAEGEKRLFATAKKAFSQRRKMLSNTLGRPGDSRRPEELSPEDWTRLIDEGAQ